MINIGDQKICKIGTKKHEAKAIIIILIIITGRSNLWPVQRDRPINQASDFSNSGRTLT